MRRLIATPLFAGSIGVLLLNDHVLKTAWPGLVTGKLSDVAGVAMVAIALTAVLRRPAAAFSLTAVGFVVLKSAPSAPEWAAPLLGGVTQTDPTDLVALAALVPLWMWVRRPERPGAVADTWALPIRIALVGAAVFATSATSCGSEGITRVADIDGLFVAADSAGRVYSSVDGNEWKPAAGGERDAEFVRVDGSQRADCAAGRCFEIATGPDGVRVVETSADPPSDLVVLSRDDRAALESIAPHGDCGEVNLWSLAAAERSDGVRLVVSAGVAGVLVMSPDGEWRWAPAGEWGIDPTSGDPIFAVTSLPDEPPFAWGPWVARLLPTAVAVGFLATVWWIATIATRNGRSAPAVWGWGIGLTAVFAALYASLIVRDLDGPKGPFFELVYVALALTGAVVLAVAAAIVWGNLARSRDHTFPPPEPDRRVG